jgi:hypothetical protein
MIGEVQNILGGGRLISMEDKLGASLIDRAIS